MKNIRNIALASVAAGLVACSQIPPEAYFDRGSPEALIDVSTETATFDFGTKQSLKKVIDWTRTHRPSEAEVSCKIKSKACDQLVKALGKAGVAHTRVVSSGSTVTFTYEKAHARDCENRYIDNTINPYNLNHPTFGCSIAVNMVQQVTDKRQFSNPALMDAMDGRKAAQATDGYYKDSAPSTEFTPIATAESVGMSSGSGR